MVTTRDASNFISNKKINYRHLCYRFVNKDNELSKWPAAGHRLK